MARGNRELLSDPSLSSYARGRASSTPTYANASFSSPFRLSISLAASVRSLDARQTLTRYSTDHRRLHPPTSSISALRLTPHPSPSRATIRIMLPASASTLRASELFLGEIGAGDRGSSFAIRYPAADAFRTGMSRMPTRPRETANHGEGDETSAPSPTFSPRVSKEDGGALGPVD